MDSLHARPTNLVVPNRLASPTCGEDLGHGQKEGARWRFARCKMAAEMPVYKTARASVRV
eukprot:7842734-Lingulodinium_polyedra.AAC.1